MNILRTALVALSIAAAAPVAAQDFTQMDITGMYNVWAGGQNERMGAIANNILYETMNNPQVQAMYGQAVQQGYYGSFEQFAWDYAQTGGFTPEGIARAHGLNAEISGKMAGQNESYMPQGTIYGPAYGAYVDGYGNIMNERGAGFSGY